MARNVDKERANGDATLDVAQIIAHARTAQATWAALPAGERLRVLERFRRALAAHPDPLIESVDCNHQRAAGETLSAEVLPLAESCRFLERNAERLLRPRRLGQRIFPLWLSRTTGEIRREPFGVVLVIGPSNYPLLLTGAPALSALAAGNAVVIKPGRTGLPAARAFADAMAGAGLDPALCPVLDESPESGRAATEAGVDRVVLTGSAKTGSAVLHALADRLVSATMELSGCDALFVLGSADPEFVARAIAFGLRINCGATCIAPHRIFVPKPLAADMERLLTERLSKLTPCTIDPAVFERVTGLLNEATASGARQLTGHDNTAERFAPVLIADATPEMRLMKSDLFCAAVALVPVEDMEQALRMDERCPFALGASVFGAEPDALQLARRVNAGSVCVNDLIAPTVDPRLPFGGRGRSGFGITRGEEGLIEMTQLKAIAVRGGRMRPHYDTPRPGDAELMRSLLRASHATGTMTRIRSLWRAMRQLMKRKPEP